MLDKCLDTNLPIVDNSEVECEEIVSTNCVNTAEADLYFQVAKGRTLTFWMRKVRQYIQALNVKLNKVNIADEGDCSVKFTRPDGTEYTFKKAPVHIVAATTPVAPNCIGDTWFNPNDSTLHMYSNDGVNDLWIQISA